MCNNLWIVSKRVSLLVRNFFFSVYFYSCTLKHTCMSTPWVVNEQCFNFCLTVFAGSFWFFCGLLLLDCYFESSVVCLAISIFSNTDSVSNYLILVYILFLIFNYNEDCPWIYLSWEMRCRCKWGLKAEQKWEEEPQGNVEARHETRYWCWKGHH